MEMARTLVRVIGKASAVDDTMGNTSSATSNTSKKIKVTPHDRAILDLKLQRDKLNKTRKNIESIIVKETNIAKELIKQDKLERAKLTLRKKKRQESLLSNLEKQSDTLEELINTIEFKLIEKDFLYGLEQGTKVLNELNNEINIDKVDLIMDESEDAISYQNQLNNRLSEVLTNGEEIEVDNELEALEIEMGLRQKDVDVDVGKLPDVPAKNIDLPDVPKKVPENKQEEEGEEEEEEEVEDRIPQLA